MPGIKPQDWLAEKEFFEETLPELKKFPKDLQEYLNDPTHKNN